MAFQRGWAGDLTIGASVVTHHGDRLGTIADVQGKYFKVDFAGDPDYWLSMECIQSATPEQVILGIDRDQVENYHVERPELD